MKPGDRVRLPKAVAKIYEAVEELKAAYPGRPFTPDGHLIGSIGEVVARETFGFDLYVAAELVYDGLGAPVLRLAGKPGSNGQRRFAISKLRQLAAN
jgi:hypothetical protein